MPAIHFEFTEYYYPDGKDFPSKMIFFWYWYIIFYVIFPFMKLNIDSRLTVQNGQWFSKFEST